MRTQLLPSFSMMWRLHENMAISGSLHISPLATARSRSAVFYAAEHLNCVD